MWVLKLHQRYHAQCMIMYILNHFVTYWCSKMGSRIQNNPKETFMNRQKGYYHYDELVIAYHFSCNSKHTMFLKDLVDTFILLLYEYKKLPCLPNWLETIDDKPELSALGL
jgi:hypothetical protein